MEYPFKSLMPLDETTARDGYYKDWTHIDADTFHQISELVKFIREKGYGADTREAIAQALERVYHDAAKSGNANMEVSMARKHFKDLASRLNDSDDKLSNTRSEIAVARRGYITLAESLGNLSVNMINKNLGKLDQTYMSDELLAQIAGDAAINAVPADGSVTISKLAISKVISANKFDKDSAVSGALNSSGQVVSNANFYTSGHVKVSAGDTVKTSHNLQAYALYNSSGTAVDVQIGAATKEVAIPDNITTIKVTFYHTNLDSFMIAIGNLPTNYQPFKRVIEDKYIGDVAGEKIKDKTISQDKLSFLSASKNLLNPEAVTKGYYIDPDNGSMIQSAQYDTSEMIVVTPNDEMVATTVRFIAFFDGVGNLMPNHRIAEPGNPTNYKFTVPSGAHGIRVSYLSSTERMQIEKGDVATPYEPYGNYTLDGVSIKPSDIIKYGTQVTNTSTEGDLTDGQRLVAGKANSLKKNKTYSFSANITSFYGLRMGQGETDYGGSYIEITADELKFFDYRGLVTPRAVLTHGLTIANFIDVLITVDKDANAVVRIVTDDGYYESAPQKWEGYNGVPFAKSMGSVLTEGELVFDTSDFGKPVYFFGDSYAGLTAKDRWVNYIREWGFDNWLINGYPGQASLSAKGMLDFALSKGNPEILIWGLGMNDGDSSTAVNENWSNTYNQIKAICESRDIELVLCTIPNVPSINNSFKNEIIRNSGYRYIDFAKAVGAEDVGSSWYTGMLSSDEVHPDVLGAQKLALQAIKDVPELASN